jgi:predicted nucleotidyltransferase
VIDEAVQSLLDGFVTSVRRVAEVEAIWLHGSLALGDFRPGLSDLDVVAVVSAPPPPDVAELHRRLIEASPLASKLHCSYMVAADLARCDRRTKARWLRLPWASKRRRRPALDRR